MRYFEIGKRSYYREEKHPREHEVLVIKGKGIVRGGDEEKVVEVGVQYLLLLMSFTSFEALRKKISAL